MHCPSEPRDLYQFLTPQLQDYWLLKGGVNIFGDQTIDVGTPNRHWYDPTSWITQNHGR